MARFLSNLATSAAIGEIIDNSNEFLYLVSPYLQVSNIFKQQITAKNFDKIDFKIIYREKSKLKAEDSKFFKENKNIKVLICDDLHSKCYMNEYEGVITSLNLYEHSQKNNWEMGVRFSKEDDSELYDGALKEVKKIIAFIANSSEKSSASSTYNRDYRTSNGDKYQKSKVSPVLKNTPKKGFLEKALDSVLGEPDGYCIRCGEFIKFNPEKPYCPEHFKSWAKYKNENYPEKYCHMCGKNAKTSKKRPVCYDCFQKFKK